MPGRAELLTGVQGVAPDVFLEGSQGRLSGESVH